MPRPVNDQVVVIAGASSGIGRETALQFADAGARVVLAARNERALETLADDIRAEGGRALAVATDVRDPAQVERLAQRAIDHFGRIDTWVNNAAIGHYGTVETTPLPEMHAVFDTVYWGTVHGIKAALARMKATGGVIINVASVVADLPVPLQSSYVAAKHAVKGFTNSLRIELMHAHVPISLVLIKPPSVDTPFFENARSRMGVAAKPIPPVYDPSVVARTIVHSAEHPRREVAIGGIGKLLVSMHALSPKRFEEQQALAGFQAQLTDRPKAVGQDDLTESYQAGRHQVRQAGSGWKVSWVMWLEEHPKTTAAAGLALAGAALTAVARRLR